MKRDKLEKFFPEIDNIIKQMDDEMVSILNFYFEDISGELQKRRERLRKRDYHLLVAGNNWHY